MTKSSNINDEPSLQSVQSPSRFVYTTTTNLTCFKAFVVSALTASSIAVSDSCFSLESCGFWWHQQQPVQSIARRRWRRTRPRSTGEERRRWREAKARGHAQFLLLVLIAVMLFSLLLWPEHGVRTCRYLQLLAGLLLLLEMDFGFVQSRKPARSQHQHLRQTQRSTETLRSAGRRILAYRKSASDHTASRPNFPA